MTDGTVADLAQELAPEMEARVSPRLVIASHILQLPSEVLEQLILRESDENPALEMVERDICPRCGETIEGTVCPHCIGRQKAQAEVQDGPEDVEDPYAYQTSEATVPPDDDYDPMGQVPAPLTLGERLIMELRTIIPNKDTNIAEYLVDDLDDNGYLRSCVEEVAEHLVVSVERVESVLAQLQTLEPAGIGARDLRECLLIQLDYLAGEGEVHPYARQIVSDHLEKLGQRKFNKIAAALRVSPATVAEAADFIRQNLNPFPARGYTGEYDFDARSARVVPDVFINGKDGRYEVEVGESERFVLRVSPAYEQISSDLNRNPERYSEEERQHIRHYLARAKFFISNIRQRRQVVERITALLVEEQREFLEKGVRYLKPLTRAAMAAKLDLHESTVSRATASKYVRLPSGAVVPFSAFFTASLSTRDIILEMVQQEKEALTDQEIAKRLAARGVPIARRTVTKYRDQLRILPSSLR